MSQTKKELQEKVQSAASGEAAQVPAKDETEKKTWRNYFKRSEGAIQEVLPASLQNSGGVRRLEHLFMKTINRNPELAACTPASVLGGVLESVSLGLEIDTPQQHAHLVPYKTEAQLIIGYRGQILLAHKCGALKKIFAAAVYKGDKFNFQYGTGEYLTHVPKSIDIDSDILYFYAYAKLSSDEQVFEVWPVERVRKHAEEKSPSYYAESSPWQTDFVAMGKKTMIRQLMNYIPASADESFMKAQQVDETTVDFEELTNETEEE
jgi:recombination protein RecT